MSNYYTTHTGGTLLEVSEELAKELDQMLINHDAAAHEAEDDDGPGPCGLAFEFYGGQGHLVTRDESSSLGGLPDAFLEKLGEVIAANNLPYLEVGYAHTGDKLRPGTCGGGEARIFPDGRMEFPRIVWSGLTL